MKIFGLKSKDGNGFPNKKITQLSNHYGHYQFGAGRLSYTFIKKENSTSNDPV